MSADLDLLDRRMLRARRWARRAFRFSHDRVEITQCGDTGFHWKFRGQIVPVFLDWLSADLGKYPER